MRVALLGCIHANLPALEAVLADAAIAGAERVVCAGDVVGWGPQPREVLALLRSRGIPSIRGHDDRRVVDLSLDRAEGRAPARVARAVRWTLDRLDDEDVRTLASFPLSYGFAAAGRTVVVVHGTPREEDETLLPETPPRKLAAFLVLAGAEVLACAHGHRAFVREVDGERLVVNVGSVGRPWDGDVRAAYALLDVQPGRPPRAELRRVEYDVAATFAAGRAAGSPRRTLDELEARARGAALGATARGLVFTAPFRGARAHAELAARTLEREAKRLRRAGRARGQDPVEATHDARVATRRLQSALSVFAQLMPEASLVEHELRVIQKGLSPARDLDVAHQLLAGTTTTDSAASIALDAALEALERERGAADLARDAALALAARPGVAKRIRALARRVRDRRSRSVVSRITKLAAAARAACDEATGPRSTDEAVHAFRIAVKRLRYAIEPFDALDPAARELARALGEAQDALGAARDRAEIAHRIDGLAERLRASGRASLAAALSLLAVGFKREAHAAIASFRRTGPSAPARVALDFGIAHDAFAPRAVPAKELA
ncbi:MAG TPA: CHAD domain-containing protein [Planctomycetota bacterium]|nr:CHAD domain-containing protein [Planctomycetota bacterium]